MKRVALFFLCFLTSVSIFVLGNSHQILKQKISRYFSTERVTVPPLNHDTLVIAAVGDMMLGTNYPSPSYLPPDSGRWLFDKTKKLLSEADIAFGNCEGTFLDSGGTVKKCQDSTKCYAFRQPVKFARLLSDAGFDMVSLANNHSGDFGAEGRNSTMQTLQNINIAFAGLISCPTAVIVKGGVKYGLAAFAPNSGTMDIRDIAGAAVVVKQLSKECDIVLVSFHGGAEGPEHQHVTRKTEMYYEENRGNIYEFAHAVVDAGADVVFGHGPHVVRALELYNNRIIAYSLGNFCTYARFNLSGPNGLAPLLEVKLNKSGEFLGGKIHPFIQEGEGGPMEDGDKKVIRNMIDLSETDFPENGIQIHEDGNITTTK